MKHYAKMPDETTKRVARLLKLYHAVKYVGAGEAPKALGA